MHLSADCFKVSLHLRLFSESRWECKRWC